LSYLPADKAKNLIVIGITSKQALFDLIKKNKPDLLLQKWPAQNHIECRTVN